MAKKSTGRLAGLAALAATAYMLSKGKGEAKAGAKDTAADREDADMGKAMRDNMAASKKADDITVSGEGGFDAPADMSRVSRVGTPASVTRSEKAPSASVAPTSSQTQRFAPSGSPVLSSGAGSGGPRIVGLGRSSGRGGPEAGEEAAYKSAKEAQALKDFSAKRPGIVARMREKDKEMAASRRNADDGGKSMVDRQNAGAKRAGLSVDDYYTSGKKTIDEQDGTFKRGGKVKKMASGGMTSKRGDGIASKGKTRCKMY
jgi:hypothetical protein